MLKELKERLGLSWQNLNHRPGDRWTDASGNALVRGRAWMRPWGWEKPGFRLEWNTWSNFCHLRADVDTGEGEATLGVAFPPVALWLSVDSLGQLLKDVGPWEEPGGWKAYDKVFEVSFHDGSIFWNLGYGEHHWSSEMPRWRKGSFDVLAFLFGEMKHSEVTVKATVPVEIPMPERSYQGTVTMKRETWKRPRLPWKSHEVLRAHIDTNKDPVPHPGKGENSWDQGEDATYGLTTPARNVAHAVGKLVGSVLESRAKHGGPNWRPTEDHRPKSVA